jgi:hypothetical protein
MVFTAIVSGTWLFKEIKHDLVFFNNFAIVWVVILSSHLLFVFLKKPKDLKKTINLSFSYEFSDANQ